MVFYDCHGFWETGTRRAKRYRSFLARENILVLPERERRRFRPEASGENGEIPSLWRDEEEKFAGTCGV